MRLIYTNAAFSQHGVPMPGVPVILSDDMRIVEGPQRWLFYIALDRGRTRSRATWRSYGEALYDWLQTGAIRRRARCRRRVGLRVTKPGTTCRRWRRARRSESG